MDARPDSVPPELRQGEYPRWQDGAFQPIRDVVAREEALELRWPGLRPLRLWSRPGGWEDLVLGHALLDLCPEGCGPEITAGGSDCFELRPVPRVALLPVAEPSLSAPELLARMNEFASAPGLFVSTGCYHRAGVYDPATGRFLHVVEDIGRHNCLDRMAGWAWRKGVNLAGLALFVSCRTTASLVEKAVRAGTRLLVTRAAPTTAGLALAEEGGLTLAGFTRPERFTLFLDPAGRVRP